jgi:cation:H+ antiporter
VIADPLDLAVRLEALPLPPEALWLLVLALGLAVLVQAADVFTRGAERVGVAFRLPPFVVGVTILAFGTSLPELVASVLAVLRGAPEIVAGNVVGSNITNLLLILGLAAVLHGQIHIRYALLRVDLPFLAGSTFLLALILWGGSVSRVEAVFCLVGLGLYLHYALTNKDSGARPEAGEGRRGLVRPMLGLVVGGALVYLGAELTVLAVVRLSVLLGIGSEVIAASVVALGTSVPEIAVTLAAARQGRSEMAVGNVLGSNVFNAFAVIGVGALVGPLPVPASLIDFALPVMVVATVITFFITMEKEMTRWEGWLMMLFYAYFLGGLFDLV